MLISKLIGKIIYQLALRREHIRDLRKICDDFFILEINYVVCKIMFREESGWQMVV